MKTTKILFVIFAFCILFSGVTIAKAYSGMDMNNPSVQLLKQLNDNGVQVRKNDSSVTKPDVSGDINRANEKKKEFYDAKREAFPSLYSQTKSIELNDKIKNVVDEK